MNPGYNPQNSNPNPWGDAAFGQPLTVAQESAEVRMNFIRKTYVLFMASILAAIVMGTICLNTPLRGLAYGILSSTLLSIGLIIGMSLLAGVLVQKPGLDYVGLFGFTSFIGFLFAPILSLYETMAPGIVGQAAFLTIVVFGALTGYVFVSRKDFSFMGGMLFVGLIALIIAGIANAVFFKSSGGSYWMAWISLFLFSGFVLYDTSQIMHRYPPRAYCAAALALFLDFFNMFMAILRILGGSRD